MTVSYLTLNDLQNVFLSVTNTLTGYPLDNGQIRIAYAEQGQPAWSIHEDVIAININPLDDPYDKPRFVSYLFKSTEFDQNVNYTRVIEVQWSCYGPSAYDNADAIRTGLLLGSPLADLDTAYIYPVVDMMAPFRFPYNLGGQWWERTDLRVRFYVATQRTYQAPYIATVPLQVASDIGITNTFTVPNATAWDFLDPQASQYLTLI